MSSVRQALSDIGTATMVACAVTAVGILFHREFFANRGGRSGAEAPQTRKIEGFGSIAATGHLIGRTDAPVTLVEFGDFECPVCRSFEESALLPIRRAYPQRLRIVFRQWPLSYHRFAYPAARAAECAGEQHRFTEYHDLLYAKQDSLGMKTFLSFAEESGVPDMASFTRCISRRGRVSAVETDIAAAKYLQLTGTPALIVNGVLLEVLPDSIALDSLVTVDSRPIAKR